MDADGRSNLADAPGTFLTVCTEEPGPGRDHDTRSYKGEAGLDTGSGIHLDIYSPLGKCRPGLGAARYSPLYKESLVGRHFLNDFLNSSLIFDAEGWKCFLAIISPLHCLVAQQPDVLGQSALPI